MSVAQTLFYPTTGGTLATLVDVAAAGILTLTNGNAGTMVIGQPVSITSANTCQSARADSQALSRVAGIVVVGAATTLPVSVQTEGPITATTAQWDAVTGGSGGLVAGSVYFLGASGTLSTAPPTTNGHTVVPLGVALSTTKFEIRPGTPVLL